MAFNSDCKVNIASDSMSATVYLTPPPEGERYSVEEVADFLRKNGVSSGILVANIESLLRESTYYYNIPIAEGTPAVDGVDGYYELFFENNAKRKPVIRSDGSADYQSMNVIHNVKAGDVLAVYHPAVKGVHGIDVKGRALRAKPGKDLPKLRGTGVDISYNGLEYKASIEGKVEYKENFLSVVDFYEHKGDLDLVVGKIDFRGDVVIHGNVTTGTYIRASKSITVEGSVEAATLIAGGDIVLKKGIHGGKRAKISSGACVYANFIEFAEVEAKLNVEANIIMNSKIKAGRDVVISGKRGAIVGGVTKGIGLITANFIGNSVGAATSVIVGAGAELERRRHLLKVKAEACKDGIAKSLMESQKAREISDGMGNAATKAAKLSQIMRRKERDERLLNHVERELKEIEDTMNLAVNAHVIAQNTAFSGVDVHIDDKEFLVRTDMHSAEFFRKNSMEDISVQFS